MKNQNMTGRAIAPCVIVVILIDYVDDLHIYKMNKSNATRIPLEISILHRKMNICTSTSISKKISHLTNTHQVQCLQ